MQSGAERNRFSSRREKLAALGVRTASIVSQPGGKKHPTTSFAFRDNAPLEQSKTRGTTQGRQSDFLQPRAALEPLCLTPIKPPEVVVARLVLFRRSWPAEEKGYPTLRRPKSGVGRTWTERLVPSVRKSRSRFWPFGSASTGNATLATSTSDARFSPIEEVTLSANDEAGVHTVPALRQLD